MKRLVARMLYSTVMVVLVLGSCVGPVKVSNGEWFMHHVDPDIPGLYFPVAFHAVDSDGKRKLFVGNFLRLMRDGVVADDWYPEDKRDDRYVNILFHMPEGDYSLRHPDSYFPADIYAKTLQDGSQLIQIHTWDDYSQRSEYQVRDNKVIPLRSSTSNSFWLFGLVGIAVVISLSKPIRRAMYRMMGVDTSINKGPPQRFSGRNVWLLLSILFGISALWFLTVEVLIAEITVYVAVACALSALLHSERNVGHRSLSRLSAFGVLATAFGITILVQVSHYSAIGQARSLALQIDKKCKIERVCPVTDGKLKLGWGSLFRTTLSVGPDSQDFRLTVERSLFRQVAHFTGGVNSVLIGFVPAPGKVVEIELP